MQVFTKVTGDKAVDRMLYKMTDKQLRRTLIQALRKFAKPIVKNVRQQVLQTGSVDTGTFKKSIGVIPSKNKRAAIVYVGARSKGANAFYFANLLEKGSSEMDVEFKGREIFDKAYNATRIGVQGNIEREVMGLIKRKMR